MHMQKAHEAKSLQECAQRCHASGVPVPKKHGQAGTAQRLDTEQQVREYVANLHSSKKKLKGPCNMWQWADRNGCFHSTKKMMASTCYANPRWKGGSRRHDVWDAVDTSREVSERRLMTFGCSMAVRGDGSYSDRIPQWLEFQLINFPTAHFFVYLRGSDGYGSFDPYMSGGMPGVVGGVAVLYPYILAGVVTVIWLPRDGSNLLNRYMDSCVCYCRFARIALVEPAPQLIAVYWVSGIKSAMKTTFCTEHGTLASGLLPASTTTSSSPPPRPPHQQSCGDTAMVAPPYLIPRSQLT